MVGQIGSQLNKILRLQQTLVVKKMRPLTNVEARLLFEKLAQFIGDNFKPLLEREGSTWTFAVHKNRVYYMREELLKLCKPFAEKCLLSAGMNIGRFTKKGRFFLNVTALPIIEPLAKYKVWIKSSAEVGFLYGQHILKEGVENIQEGTPKGAGVVIYNPSNMRIGLGVALQSSTSLHRCIPTVTAVARIGDLGEFLRNENTLS